MHPLAHTRVRIDDAFWSPRIATNRHVTLRHQHEQLVAAGVLVNFRLAAGTTTEGRHQGPYWIDHDLYKWMEAACHDLALDPASPLRAPVEEAIDLVAAAQRPDGYVNTYFQVVEPDMRWTNLALGHELFSVGTLIEAAVAHHRATGGGRLLAIATRFVELVWELFGPGRRHGYCGHEGLELALVKLHEVTGDARHLELARLFVDRRGRPESPFAWEMAHPEQIAGKKGEFHHLWMPEGRFDGRYGQDHQPVREQRTVVGHAVRAMYLYCAMADLARLGDGTLRPALAALWEHLTMRQMYITGGIGQHATNEGFDADHHLPNHSAYAETCAACGLVFWAQRMLRLSGEARHADVMERALYNGMLSGIALDGRHFFYGNPLASGGAVRRQAWFGCACCPPNVARILASLGGYIASEADAGEEPTLAIHLFIGARLAAANGLEVALDTRHPHDGDIALRILAAPDAPCALRLRIPGWCAAWTIALNGEPLATDAVEQDRGYIVLRRTWRAGDVVDYRLAMPVMRVAADPRIAEDAGRVALQRGPLVYCLEQDDHAGPLESMRLSGAPLLPRFDVDLLGGTTVIEGQGVDGRDAAWTRTPYVDSARLARVPLRAVPYALWNNRGQGAMTTWIPLA